MTWPENNTAYHLIKLYDEGVVGFSAAALPYAKHTETWKITRPESGILLTDDERDHPCVLVKCWEIGDNLQYLSIVRDLAQLESLNPPAVFVKYDDVFWNYNTINNAIQVFTVREFFELGTLKDHMIWMNTTASRHPLALLDRWLVQLLAVIDWAHVNGLFLINLSVKNICVTNDGLDLRVVDYIPAGMIKEVIDSVASPVKAPKDDHVLTLFEPHKWNPLTDFEAAGYVMLQLSIIGHPSYTRLKVFSHPYCIRQHWPTLMEAVWQNHGFDWMQILNHMLGEQLISERPVIMAHLLTKLRTALDQSAPGLDWGSGTNVSAEQEAIAKNDVEQHNSPESSVLVSFLEQAWEFSQHDNHTDFTRICHSLLKLVPTDRQSAFAVYHLDIMQKLLEKFRTDRSVTHSLATILSGILYADDVDRIACSSGFGRKLIRVMEHHTDSADLICMFGTALAQIPCLDRKRPEESLSNLPVLYRAAFAHFHDWATFVPILMCIIQEASSIPTVSLAKTPLIPLLMLTLDSHTEFPCEMHLCLRLMRKLIQTSDLGAMMLLRFRVGADLFSPVRTFIRILERHGHKLNIRREILLITVRLWSQPRFFNILMDDSWLKVFAALLEISDDKNVSKMMHQCFSDRDLMLVDHKLFRVATEPFISRDEYFR